MTMIMILEWEFFSYLVQHGVDFIVTLCVRNKNRNFMHERRPETQMFRRDLGTFFFFVLLSFFFFNE